MTTSSLKIFGSTPQVLKSSATLLRLAKLEAASRRQQTVLDKLAKVWIDIEEKNLSVDAGLKQLSPRIASIYSSELKSAKTDHELKKCISKFLKDIKSLSTSPVKKSHDGLKGPTFLVSYSRFNHRLNAPVLQNYVLKWTNWNEIISNRVYSAFASGFRAPRVAGLGFETPIHEMENAERTSPPKELVSQLKNQFLQITDLCSMQKPEDKQMMLSERLSGENLWDFICSKYQYLNPEQKQKLFKQLGKLSFLDLFMGNLDRLVKILPDSNTQQFNLFAMEANLGNLMLVQEDDLILYAIDNEIDISTHNESYLSFLKSLLSSTKMEKDLADNMVDSIQSALSNRADDEDTKNIQELKLQLKPFSEDLKAMAQPYFQEGLTEMARFFTNTLLPAWESEKTDPLKKYLSSAFPPLLLALEQRFEILKQQRRSP